MKPETIARITTARDALVSDLGRPPTLQEIGDRAGVTRERVRQVLQAAGENTRALWTWKAKGRERRQAVIDATREAEAAEQERLEADVIALHKQGLLQREIADRLGLAGYHVAGEILLRHGIRSSYDWTVKELAQLLELYATGKPWSEIAEFLGTTYNNARNLLHRSMSDTEYGRRVQSRVTPEILAACRDRMSLTRTWPAERYRKLIECRRAGMGWTETGEVVGATRHNANERYRWLMSNTDGAKAMRARVFGREDATPSQSPELHPSPADHRA